MVDLYDIKHALGIEDDYHDATLRIYVSEVMDFMVDAGVPASAITPGVVARGVSDLWNYGAGEGRLSEYFKMRTAQLALTGGH